MSHVCGNTAKIMCACMGRVRVRCRIRVRLTVTVRVRGGFRVRIRSSGNGKDYTIGTLHYDWPISAHASQAFSTSSVPIV